MFFSYKEFEEFVARNPREKYIIANVLGISSSQHVTPRHIREYVRRAKRAIVQRNTSLPFPDSPYGDVVRIGKWHRPWEVVPSLRNYRAPNGEFAVGVEIELGFTSRNAARQVASYLSKWKYVALDYEGGAHPIEATFPPVHYSKFNSKTQAVRYLKYLSANPRLVQRHASGEQVGTHINVSKGSTALDRNRVARVAGVLLGFSPEDNRKYFGRAYPYGRGRAEEGRYIEFKMFNSSTDPNTLRRYVDIAVSLADLIYSDREISESSVREALEKGYNKRRRKIAMPA